jgi:hypothetical protein
VSVVTLVAFETGANLEHWAHFGFVKIVVNFAFVLILVVLVVVVSVVSHNIEI